MIIIMDNGRMPEIESESEFLQAVSQCDATQFLSVMDGLMLELKMLFPNRYKDIIDRLKDKN